MKLFSVYTDQELIEEYERALRYKDEQLQSDIWDYISMFRRENSYFW